MSKLSSNRLSFDSAWEDIHSSQEWGGYPSEHTIRFMARNYYSVPKREDIKVLDFGCGGGAATWYLAREKFDVYAFDGAPSAVENTKKKLMAEGLQADIKVMDATKIEYADEFFDVVIDNACIYCCLLNDIKKAYSEIYRVLKSGGKLQTVAFGKRTDGYNTGIKLEDDTFKNMTSGRLQGRGTAHFYDKNSMEAILLATGFKNVRVEFCLYEDKGDVVEQLIAQAEK